MSTIPKSLGRTSICLLALIAVWPCSIFASSVTNWGGAATHSNLTVTTLTATGSLIHARWAPDLQAVSVATSLTATTNFVITVVTANVNIELPNPTTIKTGWTHRIKAAGVGGCKVVTFGDAGTIDGDLTRALSQWNTGDLVHGGSGTWYLMGY